MTAFKTGTRASVLRYMAECAIRDRQAMVDACTPSSYYTPSADTLAYIEECRNHIADFKRLAGIKPVRAAMQGSK